MGTTCPLTGSMLWDRGSGFSPRVSTLVPVLESSKCPVVGFLAVLWVPSLSVVVVIVMYAVSGLACNVMYPRVKAPASYII